MEEMLYKIAVSILIGGLIGMERQFRDKAAGFRTIILICFGTTLITALSMTFKGSDTAARVAAGILTGIGFLGGGVIIRNRGQVVGLTTAATVWVTSAIGIGIGLGEYLISLISASAVLAVLWAFPYVEKLMHNPKETYNYTIITILRPDKYNEIIRLFELHKQYILASKKSKTTDNLRFEIRAFGTVKNHDAVCDALFTDAEITEYDID